MQTVTLLLDLTYNGRFQLAIDVDMVFGRSVMTRWRCHAAFIYLLYMVVLSFIKSWSSPMLSYDRPVIILTWSEMTLGDIWGLCVSLAEQNITVVMEQQSNLLVIVV